MRRNGTMRRQETGGGRNEQKTQDTSFDDVSWAVSMFFFKNFRLLFVTNLYFSYYHHYQHPQQRHDASTTQPPPLSPGGVPLFNFN